MIKEYLFLPKYLTKKTINALLWLKKNMKILNILLTKFRICKNPRRINDAKVNDNRHINVKYKG